MSMIERGSELPSKLYKYRNTGKYTEKIFKDRCLYFAAPNSFNDPFDCSFYVLIEGAKDEAIIESTAWTLIRERLPDLPPDEQIQGAKDVRKRLLETRDDDFRKINVAKLSEETNERVGILCATEVCDDILMWAHYADCHRGICLEFSTTSDPLNTAQPVEYSHKYPALNLYDIVTKAGLRAAAPWMLRKADHWSYEREWRVLDFTNGPGERSFPAACLTGVILGCRFLPAEEAKIRQWIDDWPSEVALYRAKQSNSSFRLDIERLS